MAIEFKRAAIELFGGCNYKCTMCPQSTGRGSSWIKKMPINHFTYLLDQLSGDSLIQLEGSGEAFLLKDLEKYVYECTKRGFKSFIKTNGSFPHDNFEEVLDAGLSYIRFSVIGYDRESYQRHMSIDNYDLVIDNIKKCKQLIESKKSNCEITLYHLLMHDDHELQKYQQLAETLGLKSYVWKMHNWSGNLKTTDRNIIKNRKTCGRPFAPEITIRAKGVVTPCTHTLGPPNEEKSILGYTDRQTLEEIWNGPLYENLRIKHKNKDFDSIEYCKDCDFLYDDPEVLVWTNDSFKVGNIQGTDLNFLSHV